MLIHLFAFRGALVSSAPNNLHSNKCTKEFILFTSLKYEKVRLRLMRNLTFYFFICLISKVYFAANTNSPVMSLKNTLYLPAGTLMLFWLFFMPVP